MDLRRAQDYFSSSFWNDRGFSFNGQIMAAPVTEQHSYFLLPRRMLKVANGTNVRGGDTIVTKGGSYLVQEHTTSELWNDVLYITYRLYQITDVVTVSSDIKTIDPILGKKISTGAAPTGPYRFVIETTGFDVENGLENLTKVVRVVSNQQLAVGTVIDGKYRVETIDEEGGVYLMKATKL